MNHRSIRLSVAALAATAVFAASIATGGQAGAIATFVDLGTADSFDVLAASTVTNTGPSVLQGDLGLYPGSAVTGFPPGTVGGTQYVNDSVAQIAQDDVTNAYNSAAAQAPDVTFGVPVDLGGQTLTPGVYSGATSVGLTGTLTLDAQTDPDAVWVFQVGSTLTTASASSVLLINGAQPCNVFWQVGSSATLGTTSSFVGTIMALTSVTATTEATIDGRLLARNGAVTLDTNTFTRSTCTPPTTTSTSTSTTTSGDTTATTAADSSTTGGGAGTPAGETPTTSGTDTTAPGSGPPPQLARTGSETMTPLAIAGLLALAMGGVLLGTSRRFRNL